MDLVRLRRHEHPAPPHHELRGRRILDSHDLPMGDVEGIYVDRDERHARFIQIGMGGIIGMGEKHHLIPLEAIDEESPGSVHLRVSEEKVKGSPTFDPHRDIDEELRRTVYEYYGYPVPQAENTRPA